MIYILRGPSGSGKSSWLARNHPDAKVCSADHWFGRNGIWKFQPEELENAHTECLRHFLELLALNGLVDIAVDNTNCKLAELAPYVSLAKVFKRAFVIVRLDAPADICAARSAHAVPTHTIANQIRNTEPVPRYWPAEVVIAGYTVPAKGA